MAGGRGKIKPEDGKQFSKNYQPANPGRKPKVFSQLSREWQARGIERATPQAVAEVYEYLLAIPMLEIKEIAQGKQADSDEFGIPALIQIAAQEMTGSRGIEIIKEMLDRAHGKSKQRTELTGEDGDPIKIEQTAKVVLQIQYRKPEGDKPKSEL